jgi:hypothetical protein
MLLGALAALACSEERAGLEVQLAQPVASRFFAHGNCFAGWSIAIDVVVRETSGVEVVLDSVSVRVDDARTAEVLGERVVDATSLREQFGEAGAVIHGHGSLRLPMSVGAVAGSVDAPATSGALLVSGMVVAHDERGMVQVPYRMTAELSIDGGALPTSGACGSAGP